MTINFRRGLVGLLTSAVVLLSAAGCNEYASAGKYRCERTYLGGITSAETVGSWACWKSSSGSSDEVAYDDVRCGGMSRYEAVYAIKACNEALKTKDKE